MLRVSGLETRYGASQALFGMTLEVNAGEVVTLMGRNGMGKTTTVNSIMGMTPPSSGEILFEDERIDRLPPWEAARRGLGLAPEGRQVFPNLNVRENLVATAANRNGRHAPWTENKIYELFPKLAERRSAMGALLSGGEQQMLAVGRALMTNPKLLILDEATEGLAPLIRQEIWACLSRLKSERQSILVIDKNIADLCAIADRHYVIEKGRVVWTGRTRELQADRSVTRRYLGL